MNLDGKKVNCKFDLNKLEFVEAGWSHNFVLTIKGHEFNEKLTKDGELKSTLDFSR